MDTLPYSEVRAHLAETLKKLEAREEPVYISRRGELAGVLLSVAQYRRLAEQADGPAERLAAWRAEHVESLTDAQDDPWADVRDRRPTRPFEWPEDLAGVDEPKA